MRSEKGVKVQIWLNAIGQEKDLEFKCDRKPLVNVSRTEKRSD